ncbi:MAG: hypothetical protein IMY86_03580 [Chloroflexi bacterium]|nr:hypothetical protein [Chloroflexota bacterium]
MCSTLDLSCIRLQEVILWLGVEAIVLTLSILAFWGVLGATEGNIEGISPWQLFKLRRLLLTGVAWFAFLAGLVMPANPLFHDHHLG